MINIYFTSNKVSKLYSRMISPFTKEKEIKSNNYLEKLLTDKSIVKKNYHVILIDLDFDHHYYEVAVNFADQKNNVFVILVASDSHTITSLIKYRQLFIVPKEIFKQELPNIANVIKHYITKEDHKLFNLPIKSGILNIYDKDIEYGFADAKRFYLIDHNQNEYQVTATSFKHFTNLCQSTKLFIINRSTIVNLNCIKSVQDCTVKLYSNTTLSVSKCKRKDLLMILNKKNKEYL